MDYKNTYKKGNTALYEISGGGKNIMFIAPDLLTFLSKVQKNKTNFNKLVDDIKGDIKL
jgi:hypothetical protein